MSLTWSAVGSVRYVIPLSAWKREVFNTELYRALTLISVNGIKTFHRLVLYCVIIDFRAFLNIFTAFSAAPFAAGSLDDVRCRMPNESATHRMTALRTSPPLSLPYVRKIPSLPSACNTFVVTKKAAFLWIAHAHMNLDYTHIHIHSVDEAHNGRV